MFKKTILLFLLASSSAWASFTIQPSDVPLSSSYFQFAIEGTVNQFSFVGGATYYPVAMPLTVTMLGTYTGRLLLVLYNVSHVEIGRIYPYYSSSWDGLAVQLSFGGDTFGQITTTGSAGTVVDPYSSGAAVVTSGSADQMLADIHDAVLKTYSWAPFWSGVKAGVMVAGGYLILRAFKLGAFGNPNFDK